MTRMFNMHKTKKQKRKTHTHTSKNDDAIIEIVSDQFHSLKLDTLSVRNIARAYPKQ